MGVDTNQILDKLLASDSSWGFVLSALLILALISSVFSKAAENYGGVIGKVKKALERHKKEAILADERSNARRLDRMEATIKRLDNEVGDLRRKDRLNHEYSIYVTEYWRNLEHWAVKNGVQLPPPPMLSFPDWYAKNYPK